MKIKTLLNLILILTITSLLAGVTMHYSFKYWVSSLSTEESKGIVPNSIEEYIGVAAFYLAISQLIYLVIYYFGLNRTRIIPQIIVAFMIGGLVRMFFMAVAYGIDFSYFMNKVEILAIAGANGLVPIMYAWRKRKEIRS